MDFQRLFDAASMKVATLQAIRFPWETAGLASLKVAAPRHMPWLATCMPFLGAPPQTKQTRLPGTRVCDLPEVAALPLMRMDLELPVDPRVTGSDASEKEGGGTVSTGLTQRGRARLARA